MLGAIGDQEDKIKHNTVINRVLEKNNLTFGQCTEIVKYIDSNYITDNKKAINKTILFLIENPDNIGSILQNRDLIKNRSQIEKEITGQIKNGFKEDKVEKIIFKKFKSKFHIISDLARILANKFPDYIIVIINDLNKINNIYFRSNKEKIDLTPIIGLSKKYNYNAGGKNEVVGVYLPKRSVQDFMKKTSALLGINFQL